MFCSQDNHSTLNLIGLAWALRSICDCLGKRGYNCNHDVIESYSFDRHRYGTVLCFRFYQPASLTNEHCQTTSIIEWLGSSSCAMSLLLSFVLIKSSRSRREIAQLMINLNQIVKSRAISSKIILSQFFLSKIIPTCGHQILPSREFEKYLLLVLSSSLYLAPSCYYST